jgi:hypothetical protein
VIAVGTLITGRPPHRTVRAAFLRRVPRVSDGEALIGPGVKDAGRREKFVSELGDPFPGCLVPLAAPPQRAIPESRDMGTEHQQSAEVCRRCVVGEEAGDASRRNPAARSS